MDPLVPETEKRCEDVAKVLRGGIAVVEEIPGMDYTSDLLSNC